MGYSFLPVNHSSCISRFAVFAISKIYSNKTKITASVAFVAFLFLAGAYYFAHRKKYAASKINVEECIKRMLPIGESFQKMEKVEGGFSNDIWRVDATTRSYLFRSPKVKIQQSDFMQILEVSKYASRCGISPQVLAEDRDNQQMLLEYIDHAPWPSYQENSVPYKATMKALKCFHENMKFQFPSEISSYAPFTLIFNESTRLENLPDMPVHFSIALKKLEVIYERLKPWLKIHATRCHGDFHKGNVLLSNEKKLAPLLIDFDSMSIGDPFFDVVKFSVALPQTSRLEIFNEYLAANGPRSPTNSELAHFELIDLALLMVITVVRFKSAQCVQGSSQTRLTKNEMEDMLASKETLPSFLTMSFGDTSPKARQKGAVYALGEFLKRSEASSFNETLSNFNG